LATIACVIFDIDGTLVDDLNLIVASYNYAVSEILGKRLEAEEASALFGPTMDKVMAETLPREHVAMAIGRYHEYYRTHFHEHARTYAGILQMLGALQRAGKKLAVFTGAGEQIAKATLELSGLSSFFLTIATGDDVKKPKPDPEGLHLVMNTIGASADGTCYIGDSPVDIEASKKAGIQSGAALWGSREPNEVKAMKPDFIIVDPAQAVEILLNHA
jgi:pyrophosphatase PpaX